jgi:gluconokinase
MYGFIAPETRKIFREFSHQIRPNCAAGIKLPMQVFTVIVMGVSGCGKSTVGAALADKLGAVFLDADDFHPAANKEKMRAGLALNDDDRAPWLTILNAQLRENYAAGIATVLACSALKQRYRDALRAELSECTFIHLSGSFEALSARLAARNHEYMPATLLKSQLETLEPPIDALQIPVAWGLEKQVAFAANSILSHNSKFGV